MKTEKELRRERRIGIIISVVLLSLAVMVWQTLRFVTGYSRVGNSSMAPTLPWPPPCTGATVSR